MPNRRIADPPIVPDDLVRREDAPGNEQMPRELEELVGRDHLYFHAREQTTPKLQLERIASGADLSAWHVPLAPDISSGLPVESAEQTAPSEIDEPLGDDDSQLSLRPTWATLSFNPRPAPPRPRGYLRRRNGTRVVPEFVYWPDERQTFLPNTWPWIGVGRVDVSVRYPAQTSYQSLWSGTGTLVGKNVVLTASHIVPWFAVALNWKFRMLFTPAYYDGASTLGAGVWSWTETVKGYSDHEQGDDMAVLKLKTPLGNSLGFFGFKTYNDDWEDSPYWTLIGYPGAFGGLRPTRQSNIVVIDDDSGGEGVELEHTGDTTSGNSGGPLWGWWEDSPRVIGTHSGSEDNWDESNNVAAGGAALSKLIKWARKHW